MVEAQNMTRPMLWELKTNRIKLDADRADTQSKIAALYIPPLTSQPLKQQVAALVIQTTEKVAGKVLTADDQTRLNAETQRQLSASNN